MNVVRLFVVSVIALLLVCNPFCADAASSSLEHVKVFAVGGVGDAGTMSEGEKALRAVLSQSDAAARLQRSLPQASPAGQLYILLGLRVRDRAGYKRALALCSQGSGSVETMRGCTVGHESFKELVREIESGKLDVFITRRPW